MTTERLDLGRVLSAERRLRARWPEHFREVMTLVHTLRLARPSLVQAVETGLVRLEPPAGPAPEVRLSHRSAGLTAWARREDDGELVPDAHRRPEAVTWLQIETVFAEGSAEQ